MPGRTIERWSQQRIESALAFAQGSVKYPGGITIEGGKRAIRVGDFLAKVNRSGNNREEYVVGKNARLAVATVTTNAIVVVDDAHPFEVGDELQVDSATAHTIIAINYETNTITLDSNNSAADAVGAQVICSDDDQDEVVCIANAPLVAREGYRGDKSGLVTPEGLTFYGDAYILGTFWIDKLRQGLFQNGHREDTDLGGRYNSNNGTYIVSTVSNHYEL